MGWCWLGAVSGGSFAVRYVGTGVRVGNEPEGVLYTSSREP